MLGGRCREEMCMIDKDDGFTSTYIGFEMCERQQGWRYLVDIWIL